MGLEKEFVCLSTTSFQFSFILLTEAVTNWEEVPTTLLVHIPNICFLTCVFCIWFVNQMHQEEPVIIQNMDMCINTDKYFIYYN